MDLDEAIKTALGDSEIELYDIERLKENDKNILRVYITKKDGINLDMCSEVSKKISPLLDVYEPWVKAYNLEVSSIGIERKLKKISHYETALGEHIKVKDFDKNVFKGILKEVNTEGIKMLLEPENEDKKNEKDKQEIEEKTFNFGEISTAQTYFIWN